VRSHYYLAAAAAALSPALLAAPAAMAASAPVGLSMAPAGGSASSGVNVGDNLCVLPFRLLPLSNNNFPGRYHVCDHDTTTGPGDHILDNVCVAPLEIGDAPYEACDYETAGGPSLGPISVLRNLSVLGVNVTH
jgi:hypothetical protein